MPGLCIISRRARRVRSSRQRTRLLARDLHRCVYCGAGESAGLVLDHLEPLGLGGSENDDNLASACGACNARKASLSLLRFLSSEALAGRRLGHAANGGFEPAVPTGVRPGARRVAFLPSRLLSVGLRGQALHAYLILSRTADAGGWCWPNGRELADLARADRSFVRDALRRLEAIGAIERHYVPSEVGPQLRVRLVLTADELSELVALPPLLASSEVS